MAETNDPGTEGHDEREDSMAQMLRLAGLRPEVAPERTARVRDAVHAAWQANRRRAIRRKVVIGGIGLAAAALILFAIRSRAPVVPSLTPAPETIARSERVIGTPHLERHGERERIGTVVSISPGLRVQGGDVIGTDSSSAVALTTTDGTSVRLDVGSRVRWVSARSIDLLQGRAYIATARGASGFEVHTPFGTLHDRGTRFEVRLEVHSLRLRIRDGLVELKNRNQTVLAQAGQETVVSSSGVETKPLATYGDEWAWTDHLRPPFDIDGRTLADFLEQLAGEQGWSLRYANDELEQAAATVTLHGSVEGLSPEEALGVAISTSGFRYRLRQGELLVSRSSTAR
jgi:ferric-dicitrate binding protein FerR (iron transport regulator)